MEQLPRASGDSVAPRLDGCPSSPRLWLRNAGIGPSPQPAPRWSGAALVHPHKAGWPPTAVVARGTGREHRLSSVTVPNQPPGLAPEVLVERMRMPNLRRDGLATPRAAGAQRRVPLCSARAPPRWQEAQPISLHRMKTPRWACPRDGRRQRCVWFAPLIDQLPVASEPAPYDQLAAIPAAPELAADVPARQPDGPVPDPAEQGLTGGLDDPYILERHEVIGIVRGHGKLLLPESAPSTRAEGARPCLDRVAGL